MNIAHIKIWSDETTNLYKIQLEEYITKINNLEKKEDQSWILYFREIENLNKKINELRVTLIEIQSILSAATQGSSPISKLFKN